MLCNDMEKLSNFACNLRILRRKILLMPYESDVKIYKIMTYHPPRREGHNSKETPHTPQPSKPYLLQV